MFWISEVSLYFECCLLNIRHACYVVNTNTYDLRDVTYFQSLSLDLSAVPNMRISQCGNHGYEEGKSAISDNKHNTRHVQPCTITAQSLHNLCRITMNVFTIVSTLSLLLLSQEFVRSAAKLTLKYYPFLVVHFEISSREGEICYQ